MKQSANAKADLLDICACLCQARHTRPPRTVLSWCEPNLQQSACRAEHQQTLFYWGRTAARGSRQNYCLWSPMGSPAPMWTWEIEGLTEGAQGGGHPWWGANPSNHTHLHTHSYSMNNLDAIQPTTHISVAARKPKDPEETPWSKRKPCKLHAHRAEAETDSQPGHMKANMLTVLIMSIICIMIYRAFCLTNYQQDSSSAFKNMSYKWIKTK